MLLNTGLIPLLDMSVIVIPKIPSAGMKTQEDPSRWTISPKVCLVAQAAAIYKKMWLLEILSFFHLFDTCHSAT